MVDENDAGTEKTKSSLKLKLATILLVIGTEAMIFGFAAYAATDLFEEVNWLLKFLGFALLGHLWSGFMFLREDRRRVDKVWSSKK